ncbi:hypothetical protein KFK09_019566 [Dendrobium nobile]|uniref:Uncharacterized protein n=1 Tax=Dendrobium nobile TaxID=94219 RepID=A0A8T3APU7_DENNO|nr:hypothetical protein KFK09_019566 [Dendrobium nobile]
MLGSETRGDEVGSYQRLLEEACGYEAQVLAGFSSTEGRGRSKVLQEFAEGLYAWEEAKRSVALVLAMLTWWDFHVQRMGWI